MKIERLCNREVTLAYENERIDEVARRMRARHVGSVIVVPRDKGSAPLGVLTDRDVVRAIGREQTQEAQARA